MAEDREDALSGESQTGETQIGEAQAGEAKGATSKAAEIARKIKLRGRSVNEKMEDTGLTAEEINSL